MTKFTNYTKGPKGLNTANGLVYVEGGATVDVEISDAEAKSAKATGWFSQPKDEAAPEADAKKTVAAETAKTEEAKA